MATYTLTDDQFAKFSTLLLERAGLHFDPSKRSTLQSHIRDRAQACHAPDVQAYLERLLDPVQGKAELQRLIERVVIHETSFFRNKEHFSAINMIALPDLAQQPRLGPRRRILHIWSAGCATGEEPYSLAIACLEHPALAGWTIEILATDISEQVLDMARQGIYSQDALRYVTPEQMARWFTPLNDKPAPARSAPPRRGTAPLPVVDPARPAARQGKALFQVVEEVRKLVTFRPHNLADFPYDRRALGQVDLLLCENVLIYFNAVINRQAADEFYHCLRPGGYLFLGYSETLWQLSAAFTLRTTPGTFFYQRPTTEHPPAPPPAPDRVPLPARPPPRPAAAPPPATPPIRPPVRAKAPPPPVPRVVQGAVPLSTNVGAAVARNPAGVATAQEQTRRGLEFLEAGRYEDARAAFESALAQYPGAVGALVGIAQIHANQGEIDRAMVECRRALNLDALCEEAHLLLGLLYRHQDQFDEAINHFKKASYINSESVPAHFYLAGLYRTQGARAKAVREYKSTLSALRDHPADQTIGGMPPALIRQVCEEQIKRLQGV